MADFKRRLAPVDAFLRVVGDQYPDGDMHMLWAQAKTRLGLHSDALTCYNQCIAACPQFAPSLTEKALLLAGNTITITITITTICQSATATHTTHTLHAPPSPNRHERLGAMLGHRTEGHGHARRPGRGTRQH